MFTHQSGFHSSILPATDSIFVSKSQKHKLYHNVSCLSDEIVITDHLPYQVSKATNGQQIFSVL